MRGEYVHFRLVDVGAEVDLTKVQRLRGRAAEPAPLVTRSPAPAYASVPSPQEVRIVPDDGPAGSSLEIRIHAAGVVAVRLRTPFEASSLAELREDAALLQLEGRPVDEALEGIGQGILGELRDALVRPYGTKVAAETYLAYCITQGFPAAQDTLTRHQGDLAALVADEPPGVLSDEVVGAALKHTVRYYHDDAVIAGWDHAVVLGRPSSYEDVLDIMELANLELLEFRTYDTYLDKQLDDAFDALKRLWAPWGLFRSARGALHDISQIRVEVARLTDNLHDTGKLFGDWYMARVHQRLHARFHLDSWKEAVAAKMESLESMFHLAEEEANHRRSIILELLIVLLFIVDLAALFFVR